MPFMCEPRVNLRVSSLVLVLRDQMADSPPAKGREPGDAERFVSIILLRATINSRELTLLNMLEAHGA